MLIRPWVSFIKASSHRVRDKHLEIVDLDHIGQGNAHEGSFKQALYKSQYNNNTILITVYNIQ